jgi:hypothetical protein
MRLALQIGRSAETIPIPKPAETQKQRVLKECTCKTDRSDPELLEKMLAAG